jgi:hypothetical protein
LSYGNKNAALSWAIMDIINMGAKLPLDATKFGLDSILERLSPQTFGAHDVQSLSLGTTMERDLVGREENEWGPNQTGRAMTMTREKTSVEDIADMYGLPVAHLGRAGSPQEGD